MLYKGDGPYDIELEVYRIMRRAIAETSLLEEAIEWIGWLFEDTIETLDPMRDLYLVVFAGQIYSFWEFLAYKVIGTVQYEPLKQVLENALREERGISYNLTISNTKAREIEMSLPDAQSEQGQWARAEFVQTIEGLGFVDNARNNLMRAVENSIHKPYFDYIATLSISEGVLAKDSEGFLSEELGKLHRMEALTIRSIDKKLNELPLVKTEMKRSRLIPPGIVRGIATGAPAHMLMVIFRAAERVGNYFLRKLRGEAPFGPSGLFIEMMEGQAIQEAKAEKEVVREAADEIRQDARGQENLLPSEKAPATTGIETSGNLTQPGTASGTEAISGTAGMASNGNQNANVANTGAQVQMPNAGNAGTSGAEASRVGTQADGSGQNTQN